MVLLNLTYLHCLQHSFFEHLFKFYWDKNTKLRSFTFFIVNKNSLLKECCKQCRYIMFKGTMTKWLVQKLTQGTTQKLLTTSWRNRHLEKLYCCVFRILIFFYFLFYWEFPKRILQEMLSYRLGTVNDFHLEFKPVLSYSKPQTFSTCFVEEKERQNAFNLSNQAT